MLNSRGKALYLRSTLVV